VNKYLKLIPYKRYPKRVEELIEDGLIEPPQQMEREDLRWDEGVDIVYRLKSMTPAKFIEHESRLLAAAEQECKRYKDAGAKRFFAYFRVRMTPTKGKAFTRTYTAAMNPEPDVMIFGPGYDTGVAEPPFLYHQIDRIIHLAGEYAPGIRLDKQRPYRVMSMTISARMGMHEEGIPK